MTAEYSPSPSTDDEYSEVKGEGRRLQIHEISDSDPEDSGEKPNKSSLKTENDIEVLNHLPKRTVPNSNVPERIIFCIDTCQVADSSLFVLDHGTSFTPINMLKRITEFFLYSKQSINHNTEFALVLLKESEVVWQHHFTKNIVEIIMHLDKFEGEECNAVEFDLTKLFDLINTKVSLPEICLDYKIVPPSNVVRLILLYNRSNCLPKLLSGTRSFDMIKEHPYFTIDILYSHEDKCSGHKCLEIYDALQSLDNGYSYIFEVVKCAAKMHECAAKLLAHPLQRPLQKNSSYSFTSDK